MGSINADFVRRFRSIDQELGGVALDVAKVQIVDQAPYRGSRERAPFAKHWGTIAAPAAGSVNGFFISGTDMLNSMQLMVQVHRFIAGGTIEVFVADPAAVPMTTTTQRTPVYVDMDPEVTPTFFEMVMLVANVATPGSGVCGTFPGNGDVNQVGAPFSVQFSPPNALFIVNGTAATAMNYNVAWQCVRGK